MSIWKIVGEIAQSMLNEGGESDRNRSYNRTEINKEFTKEKKSIYASIKKQGFAKDGYTNKKLPLGGKWDFDHIVPAKKGFDHFKKKGHPDSELAKIINVCKNIVPTDRTINRSKGSSELHEVSDRLSEYGADSNLMKKAERNAWNSMEEKSIELKKNRSIWSKLFG